MRAFAHGGPQPVESGGAGQNTGGVGDEDYAARIVDSALDADPEAVVLSADITAKICHCADEVLWSLVLHTLIPRKRVTTP
jgi:hypothetical protein